jgi:hypothetical protein
MVDLVRAHVALDTTLSEGRLKLLISMIRPVICRVHIHRYPSSYEDDLLCHGVEE